MKIKYKRTHVPTCHTSVNDFNDTQLIPHFGLNPKIWVGEAEKVVYIWNKMGIIDGKQIWRYELMVDYERGEGS